MKTVSLKSIIRFMGKPLSLLLIASALLLSSLVSQAQNITFFRIGTGSTSGTYFPVGTLIGAAITSPPGSRPCEDGGSCGVPDLIAAAQTTRGSVSNIEGVMDGSLESGLAQSDIVYAAAKGEGAFKGKEKAKTHLKVIANLYPEDVHLVVRKGADIKNPQDLKGKRISIDLPGSGTRENAKVILEAFGITGEDYTAIEANADKAVGLLSEAKLDAFFFVAGYPAAAVEELSDSDLVTLLPISGEAAEKVLKEHMFFSKSSIPAGTYRGIEETRTIAVSTQWIVNADMHEELVYKLTQALWHPQNRPLLDSGHAKGKLIQLETALEGVGDLLHPGARKFYAEQENKTD
ncbi:MAG: TAXI family TRAP transporter solute-binding subunit [Sneathiellales bacterium]|nr:TAXI family TRAP transporter solute-binding subunit [Sneathiellales bacterium]